MGGAGNEFLKGDDGNDALVGGDGEDWLFGDAGNDLLFGQAGNDWLQGGFGDDLLYGGVDDDRLIGGDGPPNVPHAPRDPHLPNDGNDVLAGGPGFDSLDGGTGDNVLDAGDDGLKETILAGIGNDIAFGHWDHTGSREVVGLDGGNNRVYINGGLSEPTVPAESFATVAFTVHVDAPQGPFEVQPGEGQPYQTTPLPGKARRRFGTQPAPVKRAVKSPFAGRHALTSGFQAGQRPINNR